MEVQTKWLENVKKAWSEKLLRKGYDYAAGCLLKGITSPDELLEKANNPFDKNEFDRGIEDAVRDFHRLTEKKMTKLDVLEEIRDTFHCMAKAGTSKGVSLTSIEITSCLYAQCFIDSMIKDKRKPAVSYETWCITFQSSEQAARVAFEENVKMREEIARLTSELKEAHAAVDRWLP